MKRAGETLIEVITAMAIFGVVFAGISDFMANQTLALARNKKQADMMYYAQRYVISGDYTDREVTEWGVKFTFNKDTNTLTLSKDNASMAFKLQ